MDLRLPPHNLEAEKGLLGSILMDPGCLPEVARLIKGDDFYRDAHQTIYWACHDVLDDGKRLDAITLADHLRFSAKFESVGGDKYLHELLDATPHAANATYYAGIIREKATLRRLIELSTETLQRAYSGQETSEAILGHVQGDLLSLLESGRTRKVIPIAEVVPEVLARLQRRMNGEREGLETGYPRLDSILCGMRPGELLILAARPSMGKTALALNIAENVAIDQAEPVLFVTLEMDECSLVERLLVAISRIDGRSVRDGYFERDDFDRAANVLDLLGRSPIAFEGGQSATALDVLTAARAQALKGRISLVVIDYIQLLSPEDPRAGRQEQVAAISRRLKLLAREVRVPVLALSQLNRMSESRTDKKPRMADLRESGAIEQDADVVLLLHRPDYYDATDQPGMAELIVAKNRNGGTGTVRLAFRNSFARFDALENEADIPY